MTTGIGREVVVTTTVLMIRQRREAQRYGMCPLVRITKPGPHIACDHALPGPAGSCIARRVHASQWPRAAVDELLHAPKGLETLVDTAPILIQSARWQPAQPWEFCKHGSFDP